MTSQSRLSTLRKTLEKSKVGSAIRIYQSDGFLSLSSAMKKTIFREHYVHIFTYWLLHGKLLSKRDGYYLIQDIRGNETFYFPQLRFHYLATDKSEESTKKKYFDDRSITVSPGDVVIDIGTFIGNTSKIAAQDAKRVISLEPSPRNLFCLKKNCDQDNIEAYQLAAWNENTKMELHLGIGSSNESLIDPDDGGTGQSVIVKADRIENITSDLGLEQVDLLKIEAEGAEPEILEGIGGLNVEKVIVNCSEERDGESPVNQVVTMLKEKGFETNFDTEQKNSFCKTGTLDLQREYSTNRIGVYYGLFLRQTSTILSHV